jgi:hypothetical protein
MERNTFITSTYIAAPPDQVFEYLCNLQNLNQWSLFSRMLEQVDENTWLGTASCYQNKLYYHIKKFENPILRVIELHCGFEYGKYHQVYPFLIFSANYIDPNSSEEGSYLHWISFVDPDRRTKLMEEAVGIVHTSECRSLKGMLEHNNGLTEFVKGRYIINSDTIYIDAPLELGRQYLENLHNLSEWAHLLRLQDKLNSQTDEFFDEYGKTVKAKFKTHLFSSYFLIEQDYFYPKYNFIQRSPVVLIPCFYAFGNPRATGFLFHRITFWEPGKSLCHGKLQMEDYIAESINVKRLLEAKAGNIETFAHGMSYFPH